jgi:hypothetical protein
LKYAHSQEQIRIAAAPGATGTCPICRETLRPRCGEIVTWHWAHKSVIDCDPWQEPETEWHRHWKQFASEDRVEVVRGGHRADLISPDGAVVELQHSPISPEEIREREEFYGRMIWLLDGSAFPGSFRVTLDEKKTTFVWSPPRPSWLTAAAPIFIHCFSVGRYIRALQPGRTRATWSWSETGTSEHIFQIKSLQAGRYVSGHGRIIEVDRFIDRMIRDDPSKPVL